MEEEEQLVKVESVNVEMREEVEWRRAGVCIVCVVLVNVQEESVREVTEAEDESRAINEQPSSVKVREETVTLLRERDEASASVKREEESVEKVEEEEVNRAWLTSSVDDGVMKMKDE